MTESLIHKRVRLKPRGSLTDWRNGLTGPSGSSGRGITLSCTWVVTTQCTNMCWGPTSCKADLQKRTWWSWWTPGCSWASNGPLPSPCYPDGILDSFRQSIGSRSREVIPPLHWALVRPHLESWVQLCDTQHRREMDVLDRVECSFVPAKYLYSWFFLRCIEVQTPKCCTFAHQRKKKENK